MPGLPVCGDVRRNVGNRARLPQLPHQTLETSAIISYMCLNTTEYFQILMACVG